jgi:hypothetical protein
LSGEEEERLLVQLGREEEEHVEVDGSDTTVSGSPVDL